MSPALGIESVLVHRETLFVGLLGFHSSMYRSKPSLNILINYYASRYECYVYNVVFIQIPAFKSSDALFM